MTLPHIAGSRALFFLVAAALNCSAHAADVVPLTFINDLPFVALKIGAASSRMMFDSGGSLGISLPEATVKQSGSVKLLDQTYKFSDLQGQVYEVQRLEANQVVVGKTELGPVAGRIHRDWGGAPEGPDAELTKARQAGAIGLGAFGNRAVMFDYRLNQLTIYAPGETPQAGPPNWYALHLNYGREGPNISLIVNGKSLKFVLDTGTPVNLVNADSLAPAGAQEPCAASMNKQDCDPDFLGEVLDENGKTVGKLSALRGRLGGVPFDGLLGAPFFKSYRVLFDVSANRLLLSPYNLNDAGQSDDQPVREMANPSNP